MAQGFDSKDIILGKGPSSDSTSSKAIRTAIRKGEDVETTKKYTQGNKQIVASKNTAKLDRETEEVEHATVTLSFSKTLQQARVNSGLTQKELATKINEKPQVVNDYESGKAVPNQAIISKLERAVGTKLRGKEMGQPLGSTKK